MQKTTRTQGTVATATPASSCTIVVTTWPAGTLVPLAECCPPIFGNAGQFQPSSRAARGGGREGFADGAQ